jgi:hypothetical protein
MKKKIIQNGGVVPAARTRSALRAGAHEFNLIG